MIEIRKHRNKESVDWSLLKTVIGSFIDIGILKNEKIIKKGNDFIWAGDKNINEYEQVFQTALIAETSDYYQKKKLQWINQLSCPEYIEEVLTRLADEDQISGNNMEAKTRAQVMATIDEVLVKEPAEEIIDKEGTGCEDMFKNKKVQELKRMYELFSRVEDTLKFILRKMQPYIQDNRGKELISDESLKKDPIKFTEKLLELKKEMDTLVQQCFNNDMTFQQCRDLSFQNFMNEYGDTSEYIARYCDYVFKTGIRGMSENEIDETLSAIIRLFCCLYSRDTFILFYTKFQADRLLSKTSLNNEAEQNMIKKLKVECGFNTVSKLSRMFTDMELSQQTMTEFTKTLKGKPVGNVDLTVDILTNGMWPEQEVHPCKLPAQLQDCTKKFEMFYKNKHSGRHLTWLLNNSNCEMDPTGLEKKYILKVSTYQASILMLFNNQSSLSFSQIKEMTNLPEKELNVQLKNLFNPKHRLLAKDNPKVAKCKPDENIRVNVKFKNKLIKVTFIPQVVHKKKEPGQQSEQDKKVLNEIKQERKHVLDAMIVRIMKARKQEKHMELTTEVMKQVTLFRAQPAQIKQSIERLIEKEYLERDENDRQKYTYLP